MVWMRWLLLLLLVMGQGGPMGAKVYDVRHYGARGDGRRIDSPAINKAIEAAAKGGGGMVYVPAGTYACYSIHLASHVHLYLETGAVIRAAEGKEYDLAEPGPEPQYQDFGHSHFQNSLFWGIGLEDVTISGRGRIDGSALSGGYGDTALEPGVANKTISLRECRDVTLRDFTVLRGGHFVLLATGVENLLIDGVTADTNRDGFDIDCCRNVRITNCNVNSPDDDGIVLKASYALGRYVDTQDVIISNCHLSGYAVGSMLDGTYRVPDPVSPHNGKPQTKRAAGRIKLGTESSGGFQNVAVTNCTFDFCGGVLIESMDGGWVEDIVVSNLTMRNCLDSPLFVRLGARMRSPEGREIGHIRRVLLSDINAWDSDHRYGVIVAGLPGHDVEDITLRNIHLNTTGDYKPGTALTTLKEQEKTYPDPWIFSGNAPMPDKGMYLRHVNHLTLDGVHFSFNKEDERPLFITEDVRDVRASDITSDHVDVTL